jgi:hypothetical protein
MHTAVPHPDADDRRGRAGLLRRVRLRLPCWRFLARDFRRSPVIWTVREVPGVTSTGERLSGRRCVATFAKTFAINVAAILAVLLLIPVVWPDSIR